MNCQEFHKMIPDLLAGTLSPEELTTAREHLTSCPACAEALRTARETLRSVTPRFEPSVPEGLEARLLDAVHRRATVSKTPERRPRRRLVGLLSGVVSAAAVVIVVLTFGLNTPARAARNRLTQAIASMEGLRSIRIELRIRTSEQENFDYIDPHREFIPHTLEAIYSPRLLWRVEKPGRKALYDGEHTYLWFDSLNDGLIQPYAPDAIGMLNLLIDPSQLLELERQLTRAHTGARYELRREAEVLYLTVISPAQGDFSQSDHERNTSIIESNTRREYRFDALNGRLLGARVTLLAEEGERALLEIDRITYDAPLDTATLTVLPEGINWTDQTRNTPSPRLTGIDAKEAARLILAAFATWDNEILDEALRSYGAHARKLLQSRYAGATVERLSEPVRSGKYPGWFIPCTLRMGDGSRERIRLALRNDNSAGSWVVDGGL
ncbi:anti-sigma factor [uncultured Alistipes sp.]|uniref:anti-sigma factor family protein n=1 Tax=uncultured Alistipes sp. TaxID=538949 RepID=UPI0026332BE8|nr:zf-HC2 domain-containing protein [uncultured Alistipes sp.]